MRRPQLKTLLWSVLLAMSLGMGACSGDDCPINNTVQGKMAFYSQHGEALAVGGTLTVAVVRPQGDSVVLNQKSAASEVLFPLSYAHDTDTLVLIFNNTSGTARDSLYVAHTNTPTLVSVDCGTAMFHSITTVGCTHHVIDTLILKSPEVDYDERENIQIICHIGD